MSSVESIVESHRTLQTTLLQRMSEFEAQLKASSTSNDSVAKISKEFSTFRNSVFSVLSAMQEQIAEILLNIDNIEMRHRKKYLLISGVPEEDKEDLREVVLDMCHNKLGMTDIDPTTFTACLRLGTNATSRKRPILIKLQNVSQKSVMWRNKTKLKGTNIVLAEFLTRHRQFLFAAARKHFGIRKVWTTDGNINIKLPNGKLQRVQTEKDLKKLISEHQQITTERATLQQDPTNIAAPITGGAETDQPRAKRNPRKK